MGGQKTPLKRLNALPQRLDALLENGIVALANAANPKVRKRKLVDTGIYSECIEDPDGELVGLAEAFPQLTLPKPKNPLVSGDSTLAQMLGCVQAVIDDELESPANERSAEEAKHARRLLESLVRLLGGDLDERREDILFDAFELGQSFERMKVRRLEHYALTGKKHRAVSAKAGRATKSLTKEQEELVYKLVLEEQGAGVSTTGACKRVADHIRARRLPEGVDLPNVSQRTVYRAFLRCDNA